jgi:rod shape-determining protein MreD
VTARIAVFGLVLTTALLIETVVLSGLSVAGVSPAVVVLTVVGVSLTEGPESGLRYGFAAGLTVDLLSGGLIGLVALVYLLVGYGAGVLRPFLSGSALVTQVVLGAVAGGVSVLGYGSLTLLFDPEGLTIGAVLLSAIVTMIMSGLLAPFVVRPVGAALRRVDIAALVT